MKNGKKKMLLTGIAVLAAVAMAVPSARAQNDHELAAENDPFWTIVSQMTSPEDASGCTAAVSSYINGQNFSTNEERQGALAGMTAMCSELANMPDQMEDEMTAEGVTSNLFDADDWHNVQSLYFQKSGTGKIQFTNTIDFMSYRFMTFMENFRNMVEFSDGYISLNAAMVSDMRTYGAQLTMLGLDFSATPDIYVTDANGTTMHKATSDDISAISYDPNTGTLTFNTSHFSAFKAVSAGARVKTMKISGVKPNKIKYKAKKNSFKLAVKGKGFYKKGSASTCTLGFVQATKTKVSKNGKNAVCTFRMTNFSTLGYYPLSIGIVGQGEVTRANAVRVR
jgi:hypothetical protein